MENLEQIQKLYDHRNHLIIIVINDYYARDYSSVWKTKRDIDEYEDPYYFIVGFGLKNFNQVTYHLPMALWDSCNANEIHKSDWDGHTSDEALRRLKYL